MKRVEAYVQKHRLIEQGDRVLIGLSGGADSVCLLFVLKELQKQLDFEISAVHINHNLRGQEAVRDQVFVDNLCKELQVPLEIKSVDVSGAAELEKIGFEEAGRRVRYEVFEEFVREQGITKIALAHHQNDQAETMLYHLARGTDLTGLAALRPKRGHYIRPLLCVTRREILQYMQMRQIGYVTDSSNNCDDYTRNRIRHHVVSYLEKEVNPQCVVHMSETAESLGELYEYLLKEAKKKLELHSIWEKDAVHLSLSLFQEDKVLSLYVIRLAVERLAGSLKDIGRLHLQMVQSLGEKEVGKSVNLPYELVAEREYAAVCLRKGAFADLDKCDLPEIALPDHGSINWGGYQVTISLESGNGEEIPEKKYTKWFDYDKINDTLVLRVRRTGDYMIINREGGKKKIKDYFIDQKVPQKERDQIPLLCLGQEVLWAVGYRISEAYKVTEQTQTILKVQISAI